MLSSLIAAIFAALQAIPILNKWFVKSDIDKENEAKQSVDKEHEENSKDKHKRPSGEFWKKDRGL